MMKPVKTKCKTSGLRFYKIEITKIPCVKRGEKNIMKRKVLAITLTAMMAAGMLCRMWKQR